MRLAERQKLAAEKAQELMAPKDYKTLALAIKDHKPVLFKYTDRFGTYAQYRANYVEGFVYFPKTDIWPGSVCVWSFHNLHGKKEQYRVERIEDVKFVITLLEALLDPSSCADFWAGEPALTGWEPSFEELSADIKKQTSIGGKDRVVLEWLKKQMPPNTRILYDGNTEEDYDVYSVYIAGVKLYFSALDEPALAAARTLIELSSIPPRLLAAIPPIHVTQDASPYGFEAKAIWDHGLITVLENNLLDQGSLIHEAGHAFAYSIWGDPRSPAGSDYKKAIDSGEPPPSEYAKLDISEDFAEAVRMFVVDPVALQKVAPLRYNVIKRLMKDKNYRG